MGYRDLGNIDEKIVQTVIEMGAANGVSSVSPKKIAEKLGISAGTIYNRFGSLDNVIEEAAKSFDRPYIAQVIKLAKEGTGIYDIWDRTLEAFLANPNGTLFYISYLNTAKYRYNPTGNSERNGEFLAAVGQFMSEAYHLPDAQALMLWEYVTNMMFYYSEKIISNNIYDSPRTRAFIKRIVFDGVNNVLDRHYDE